jgi:ABC-type transporter Mla subunit MlaD
MRRRQSGPFGDLAGSPVLVGAVAALITVTGVFLSYNANEGLPFVPTYKVSVDVPDAAELVRGDEVRVGGARVGKVKAITAMPAKGEAAPFARIEMALNIDQSPLPADTKVQVRPRSILGSKYLALTPGRSKRGVPERGVLVLRQAEPVVEIDEAFGIFDPETTEGLRGTLRGLGDATAGRGTAINQSIESARRFLPPLERFLRVLASPEADVPGFVDGAAATASALAGVADTLGSLIDRTAVTLAALDAAGSSLGETIEALPRTEIVATRTLRRLTPVLDDAAALARGLRSGSRLLPVATRRLDRAVAASLPVLRDTTGRTLGATFSALNDFARNPATMGAARRLYEAVQLLAPNIRRLAPAQTLCNVAGIFVRNLGSTMSEGDAAGTWLRFTALQGTNEIYQSAKPDPNLHLNFYANETASECEAGNEPYLPGQHIGNPPGNQSTQVDQTSQPAEARELARRAGLNDPPPRGDG